MKIEITDEPIGEEVEVELETESADIAAPDDFNQDDSAEAVLARAMANHIRNGGEKPCPPKPKAPKTPKVTGVIKKPRKGKAARIVKTAEHKKKAAPNRAKRVKGAKDAQKAETKRLRKIAEAKKPASARDSKADQVIALLDRPGAGVHAGGATAAEIMELTGWQAHTVRGFVAGTLKKKLGLEVNSFKNPNGDRQYRIIRK